MSSVENPKSDLDSGNIINTSMNSLIESKSIKQFSDQDRKFIFDIVDLFSSIKGKKLEVFFNNYSGKHFITYNNKAKSYQIYTDPYDKKIFWKTALEHEI